MARTAQTGQEFTIRTAQPEDAAGLLAYIHRITKEPVLTILEPDEIPATEEKERQWVQDHLDHPGKILLVAEASWTILGPLVSKRAEPTDSHRGSFGISVVKDWRGQGIGKAYLRPLEWATANPLIEKVNLGAFATNDRAIRLYKRLGFVEEGCRPKEIKFGPGRYGDGVSMYRFVK